jgi:hypothetical protein
MLEEIKKLEFNEDVLKKYDIKSVQVVSLGDFEPSIHILFNNGIILNSNIHRYEIIELISSMKSDYREDKINTILL